jgi:hypothetical protein
MGFGVSLNWPSLLLWDSGLYQMLGFLMGSTTSPVAVGAESKAADYLYRPSPAAIRFASSAVVICPESPARERVETGAGRAATAAPVAAMVTGDFSGKYEELLNILRHALRDWPSETRPVHRTGYGG